MSTDVIDTLLQIAPGSRLDHIRHGREVARANMQASYEALFEPGQEGDVPLADRFALAAFVAGLHREVPVMEFYAGRTKPGPAAVLRAEIDTTAGAGPYGSFPAGPLTVEDTPGPEYILAEPNRGELGPRLSAAFEHIHMLVFHPRDASASRLQRLLDAGWTTTGVVTLSQLVSFLSFQVRVVIGLRALGDNLAEGH